MGHTLLILQRFYDAWSQYNEDQVAYRQKRKDQMLKKIKVAGTDLSDDQIEQMIDEGKTEVFAKSILDQTQMARQQLTELQVSDVTFFCCTIYIHQQLEMY